MDENPPDSLLGSIDRSYSSLDVDRDGEESSSEQVASRLIPALPDELVEEEIWPLLSESPEALLHLRCVSRRWRSLIDPSLELDALNLVLLTASPLGASGPTMLG